MTENSTVLYTTSSQMDRTFFDNFASVGYHRLRWHLTLLMLPTVLIFGGNLWFENYSLIALSLLLAFLTIMSYLKIKKESKLNYERHLFSAGKKSTQIAELFEDKIVVCTDEVRREYAYGQITGFYETRDLLLLRLQHNLCIALNKTDLHDPEAAKAFLLKKCTGVKKKKFIDCSRDRTWALILTITLCAACIALYAATLALYTG